MNEPSYITDQYGIIHQDPPIITAQYNKDYVESRYVKYGVKTRGMAMLRLGFIQAQIGREIDNVVDVGYGDGSFLKACAEAGAFACGYDISEYPLPDGVERAQSLRKNRWQVVTFFDSLEHFEDISFVRDLVTQFIVITAPECHWDQGAEKFKLWKHRRPGEHLHHFNRYSLTRFMDAMGYEVVAVDNIEDAIRGEGDGGLSNTFTAIFKAKE